MASKFQIIEQSLIVTDSSDDSVLFDAPQSNVYYDSKKLDDGTIYIYDTSGVNAGSSQVYTVALADAIDDLDVPFTDATFRTFARENML